MAPKAAVKAVWATPPSMSAICGIPTYIPGGKPVSEVPGDIPMSPVTSVGPVLVTETPARMANDCSEPRSKGKMVTRAVGCGEGLELG